MEDLKLLVQEEGRSARNLVAFNVPVIQTQCDFNSGKLTKKPPTSPRSVSEFKKDESKFKRSRDSSQSRSRVRSASTGRDKKSELHARYWAFLFGNLQRAVDEIYQTCEMDESVTECKEVIMVLDNYTREFRNLINWFKIKWEYETTPPPQRPRSLAWEIRKSSPGKIRHKFLESVSNVSIKSQMACNTCDNKLQLCANSDKQLNLDLNERNDSLKTSVLALQNSSSLYEVPEVDVNPSKSCNVKATVIPEVNSAYHNPFLVEDKGRAGSLNENFPEINQCNLKLEIPSVEPLMIDEICQTDLDKEINESGLGISSGQLCTATVGLNEVKVKDKENLSKATEGHLLKTSISGISKTLKTKENTRTSIKTIINNNMGNKISAPSNSNLSLGSSKSLHYNSYSRVTEQPKVIRSLQTTKTNLITKVPQSAMNDRASLRGNQKPLPTNSGKFITSASSSSKGRLTWCQTTSEIQGRRLVKTTPNKLKQDLNERKSKAEDTGKMNSKVQAHNSYSSASVLSLYIKQDLDEFVELPASKENLNEEDDGWVKVRSKSRFSPGTKAGDLETTLSRSACNLKSKGDQKINKMVHKTRFHQPSSAMSLPTLAFSTNDCKENITVKKMVESKNVVLNKSNENFKIVKKEEQNKLDKINGKKKSCSDKIRRNFDQELHEKNLNQTLNPNEYKEVEKAENERNICLSNGVMEALDSACALDQDTIDEDENHFDEELKKNKEKEEMLQKEINDLEAADIEVDLETGDEETDGEATTGTEEELDQDRKLHSPVLEVEKTLLKKHRCETIFTGISWADHMNTLDELEKLVVQDCSKKGMTKDEQIDTLERLEEFVARHPGRALELHQKLSSPSRRRTMLDTVKRFQARQAKASEKREQLKMEKAQKLRELLKKVDEVKAAKDKLIEERRQRLEMKLKRAAENRNLHLKEIMRKAHDEEEKLKEIAFINELEAQNKRHDFMTQCQEQEDRLQGIHEERQRKQEEKAAKEAAFEERRKAIEAERQEKLEKMQERQRKRDEQADKKKQEKEKERQEIAREKARDRSERLEALHAAQLEAQEELQKKIQQKQEDYARRHEENIEQIRQKALELSILKCSDDIAPKLAPYEIQKLCTACNVLICSTDFLETWHLLNKLCRKKFGILGALNCLSTFVESFLPNISVLPTIVMPLIEIGSEVYLLSHLRGKKHHEMVRNVINGKDLTKEEAERFNIKIIVNAPSDKIDPKIILDKERSKCFKKKSKKIRLRMIAKGEEFMLKFEITEKLDSPGKNKLQKCLKDIEKALKSQGKGQWSDSAITILERAMGEIRRLFKKQNPQDQLVFRSLNGFAALDSVLKLELEVPPNVTPYLPQKCFVTASSTYLEAIHNCTSNRQFVILSNYIISLLDLLMKRLTILIPEHNSTSMVHYTKSSLPFDPLASALLVVITKILTCGENTDVNDSEDYLQRLQDIISYTVSSGIVDRLTNYCKSVRDPVDDQSADQFLLNILGLFTALISRCKGVRQGGEDPTQLLATLQVTELVGAVSILYGMLHHQGTPPRLIDAVPPLLSSNVIAVAVGTIRLLQSVAELDLQMFQSILGAEGISLQFRHIASYLLWYCCHDREKVLLHEVITIVGYFAVLHRDNQCLGDEMRALSSDYKSDGDLFFLVQRVSSTSMILQSGSTPTVLQQLCSLPFPYFSNPELSVILFPTLLACCFENEENKAILEQEISYSLLEDFMDSDFAKEHPLVRILSSGLRLAKS